MTAVLEQLDYIYPPSRNVAADVTYFTEVLGARLVFAIEGMGTRVAMVELADGPPMVVLAGHLDGDRPILVYRVADLKAATAELRAGGSDLGRALEIPQGPVRSFTAPGGQQIALYQLTRPGVVESFAGRRDF